MNIHIHIIKYMLYLFNHKYLETKRTQNILKEFYEE